MKIKFWGQKIIIAMLIMIAIIFVYTHFHQDCFYRVSKTGNIYSPTDRYWSLTSYKKDLCLGEATEESNRIKLELNNQSHE